MHSSFARGVVLAAPTLLAASIVLSAFNEAGGGPATLLRPLLLAPFGALILTAVAWAGTRRDGPAAIAASGAVLLLMGGLPLLMAIIVLTIAAAVAQWNRIRRRPVPRPSVGTLAIIVLAIFVTSVVWLPLSGGIALEDFTSPTSAAEADEDTGGMPNMYVLILDSYPRQDTLSDTFGLDNTPFLDELRSMGFDLYPNATSPTVETPLTVLAMLSGPTSDLPTNWAAAAREARRRLTEAPGLADLAEHGYRRVVINSSAVHMEMAGWDVTYQPGQLNNLEATLLSRSPLAPLVTDWVFDQQRERFDRTLDILLSLADSSARQAVLAHVGPPHPPLLYGPDGEPADPAGCWPRCDLFDTSPERLGMAQEDFASAFADQVEVVNRRVAEAVDQLIRADPEAVVIVMSDHGTRSSLADREEWNRTLLASRTPGHERLLEDDPTPLDLFRRLIAAYEH